MAAKMDKSNVIFPSKGQTHAKLGVYSSMKSNLEKIIAAQVTQKSKGSPSWNEADSNIKEALQKRDSFVKSLARKGKPKGVRLNEKDLEAATALYEKNPADFDAYWKMGIVGKNLVVRIKIRNSGFKKLFGYEEIDAVVLKDVELKTAQKKEPNDKISFPSYVVLDPGDVGKIVKQKLELDKPYKIKLSIEVSGSGKSLALTARIREQQIELCEEYQKGAKEIVTRLEKSLLRATATELPKLVDAANKELGQLLSPKKVQAEFERRVKSMVAREKEFAEHHKEWKFKIGFDSVIGTIKLATNISRLAATAGADAMAYANIASIGYSFYSTITDYRKTEQVAAQELVNSITRYRDSANGLVVELEKIYKEFGVRDGSTLSAAILAAEKTADQVKAKIHRLLKGTLLEPEPEPQKLFKRYLVSLHQVVKKADQEYNKLGTEIDAFRNKNINDAVAVWPALVKLKQAAAEANETLKSRKQFADSQSRAIDGLGIELDDSTTLAKLRKLRVGIQNIDTDKIKEGASGAGAVASSLYTSYSAVNKLQAAVKAVV